MRYGKRPPPLNGLVDQQSRKFTPPRFDRPTLLYFWADWCEPCIAQGIPHLLEFAEKHKGERFQIVAIHENGIPEQNTVQHFQQSLAKLQSSVWRRPLNIPFAFDSTGSVTRAWGLSTFPTYAFINAKGHLERNASLEQLEASLLQEDRMSVAR